MEITAKHLIKHDGKRYEPGETYDVPDAVGALLVGNGWATAEGVPSGITASDVAVVDLQPDSTRHTTTSEVR